MIQPYVGISVQNPSADITDFESDFARTVVNIGKPGEGSWRDRLPGLDLDEVVTKV
jgi:hypothetical protein